MFKKIIIIILVFEVLLRVEYAFNTPSNSNVEGHGSKESIHFYGGSSLFVMKDQLKENLIKQDPLKEFVFHYQSSISTYNLLQLLTNYPAGKKFPSKIIAMVGLQEELFFNKNDVDTLQKTSQFVPMTYIFLRQIFISTKHEAKTFLTITDKSLTTKSDEQIFEMLKTLASYQFELKDIKGHFLNMHIIRKYIIANQKEHILKRFKKHFLEVSKYRTTPKEFGSTPLTQESRDKFNNYLKVLSIFPEEGIIGPILFGYHFYDFPKKAFLDFKLIDNMFNQLDQSGYCNSKGRDLPSDIKEVDALFICMFLGYKKKPIDGPFINLAIRFKAYYNSEINKQKKEIHFTSYFKTILTINAEAFLKKHFASLEKHLVKRNLSPMDVFRQNLLLLKELIEKHNSRLILYQYPGIDSGHISTISHELRIPIIENTKEFTDLIHENGFNFYFNDQFPAGTGHLNRKGSLIYSQFIVPKVIQAYSNN